MVARERISRFGSRRSVWFPLILGALAWTGAAPRALGFTISDFAVDPAHAAPWDSHDVVAPPFNNFQLTIYGTFNTNKCYEVQIKHEGGGSCGSANSSGTDTAEVFADHLLADISPTTQAADFKAATNWRIEIRERDFGCTGTSTIKTIPENSGQSYLKIRGCNASCLLSSSNLILTVKPNPADCGELITICAQKYSGGVLGSGNLEYDWDFDGDGTCGVCSGGTNNGKKCGEPSDCPNGVCLGGGGFDDLTTNTGDSGCSFGQPCCVTTTINTQHVVGVKVRDKGTNVPCTTCKTKLVYVSNGCDDKLFCNGTEACDGQSGCVPGTPPNCDDGNPCTTDYCSDEKGRCKHTPNNALCNNGLYCDGVETCHETLGCQVGTAPNCNDGVTCTTDTCNEATDSCVHTPDNGACSDGLYCSGTETCNAVSGCQAGTPPDCNDGIGCTTDACNEADDVCAHTANNNQCDNGQFCDGAEACDPVLGCQSGAPPNCNDGLSCTHDSCNETTDVCEHVTDNALCSNGQYCDGDEVCHPTLGCQAGAAPNCTDGVACTTDACDEATDACTHTANAAACGDGQFCNGVESCDLVNGCQSGPPVNCSDGIACTQDACDEATDTCLHTPNSNLCDNGLYCDGVESCDAAGCHNGTPVDCNDGIACTVDACNETNDTCTHTPDDTACGNGSFCDGAEYCDSTGCHDATDPCAPPLLCDEPGVRCVSCLTDAQCNDGLFCNGAETCSLATGECVAGTPPTCDDGLTCTVDSCNPGTNSCVHTADDAACNNGDYCDGDEVCHVTLGCQPGTPVVCADGVFCTIDFCDEATNSCVFIADDFECADGFTCNGDEVCDPINGCQPGTPVDCSDGFACTLDECIENNEAGYVCTHDPSPDACNDGLYCNGVEYCDELLGCRPGTPPNCGDAVGCTVDTCDEANDRCEHVPDDAVCNNNQFCDGLELCDPTLGCQPGTPVNCSDGVACTLDACDEALDTCVYTPDNSACNDLLFCNGVETCDALLGCQGGTAPDCNDNIPCTADACDEATDTCTHLPNDASCDNGLFCDGGEVCDPMLGCQDVADPCAPPTKCVEAEDRCVICSTDAQCNDGLFCTGVETCDTVAGVCVPGTPPTCGDGILCTVDVCDPTFDTCKHIPSNVLCADGLECNGNEQCSATLGCLPGSPHDCDDGVACTIDSCNEDTDSCDHVPTNGLCDDGLFCNGVEACHPQNGCLAGTPPDCNDGIACTLDTCNESTDSCDHAPNDAMCSDGLFCTGVEICDPLNGCQAGTAPNCNDGVVCTVDACDETNDVCTHVANDALCNDGLYCNGVEFCDPLNGCQSGPSPNCDDAVPCTIDSCDEVNDSCLHLPDNTLCQNGLFCDGQEFCDPVLGCQDNPDPCAPPTKCVEDTDRCVICSTDGQCNDGLFCNGEETCNVALGICIPGTAPDCDDGVVCTTDACDETANTCTHTPNNGSCDDQQYCNGVEFCDASLGCQPGTPPNCDDGIICTVDSCSETDDLCMHAPDNGSCNNGLFCDGVEVCSPLTGCGPGTPPNCDDGITCTTDACDEVMDTCTHAPDDLACSNGLFCDGAETCDPVNGCVSGPAPNCNDGVDCTLDSCNEAKDMCVHGPSNAFCSDKLFCNGVEICDPINGCQAGPPPNCDDSVGCTVDACDENTDLCTHHADDQACDDTFFCTGVERCDAQAGCVAGPPPVCEDSVECTVDACDALTDVCVNTPNNGACDDFDRCTTDTCTAGGCVSINTFCGACCLLAGPCMDNSTAAECTEMPGEGGSFLGVGTVCTGLDSDDDGIDDACDLVYTIPTVSEWGLVILTLMLLSGAKVAFGRRRSPA